MTEEEIHEGGETEGPHKLDFWGTVVYLILRMRHGGLKRDKRRKKGRPSPTKGICGPINHGEDGHPWVWLEVTTIRGYQMKTTKQRARIKANLEAAIKSFVGWGEIDIQVQALPYGKQKIQDSQSAHVLGTPSDEVARMGTISRKRAAAWIKEKGFRRRQLFIGVRMRDERTFTQVWLAQLLLWCGFSSTLANGDEEVIYRDQIKEVLGKFQNNGLQARLLNGVETAQVIQRCVYRGHQKLPELADNSGVIRSAGDLHRLTDSVARDYHHMVQIMHQDGEATYASYMAVAKLPDVFDIDWLFVGDEDRRPVEVSARLKMKPNERAGIENDHTLLRIKNSLEDLAKKKTPDQKEFTRLISRQNVANRVKERLDGKDEPMIDVNAFMIVSADTVEKLKSNRQFVMNSCDRRNITLEIDEAYQAEIRRQTYPGTRQIYDDYKLTLFCDGMACAVPHATSLIGNGGDLLGVVLGYEYYPYMYSHRAVLSIEVDAPTGQVFIGPSGEGKTDAMVNRAIADAIANMAAIFDEGKGDTKILEGDHELLVDIAMMNLSSPEMAGLLNPLYLGSGETEQERRKESRDLTLNVLMKSMGDDKPDRCKPILAEVLEQEFMDHPDDPDFERIVRQRLMGAPETDHDHLIKREIGRAILPLMGAKHSDVIFAKGKPWQEIAERYIRRGQVTFVVYGHLQPPDVDKKDDQLSEQERLALIVRDLTNVIYYKFAMNPELPLAIYKDEIQIDKRMGGSVSSDHLSRIGRSKGSTISLGGQHLDDVPQGFWENTSTYNFFRFNQWDNAVTGLKYLNFDVEKDSKEEHDLLLMLMKDSPDRRKYDVVVKTYDGEIALVAFKQFYHGGRFVSNIQGVEQRRLRELEQIAANQLPFARKARSPSAATAALAHLGVPADVINGSNGYSIEIQRWIEVVMHLRDDELLVSIDGELQVVRKQEIPAKPLSLKKSSVRQPDS